MFYCYFFLFFFFNDTATTEIYTLSLHDALPIFTVAFPSFRRAAWTALSGVIPRAMLSVVSCSRYASSSRERSSSHFRSEEHTSELQSRQYLVCRLLLEKKKKKIQIKKMSLLRIR